MGVVGFCFEWSGLKTKATDRFREVKTREESTLPAICRQTQPLPFLMFSYTFVQKRSSFVLLPCHVFLREQPIAAKRSLMYREEQVFTEPYNGAKNLWAGLIQILGMVSNCQSLTFVSYLFPVKGSTNSGSKRSASRFLWVLKTEGNQVGGLCTQGTNTDLYSDGESSLGEHINHMSIALVS